MTETKIQLSQEKEATQGEQADWHNCYDLSWKGIINDESFAHPAKFSRGLIRRIYEHALDRGWVKPGDTVLDPFGGVGLGALHAGINGLNFIGCELESRFVDMGAGVDCENGECPACQAKAGLDDPQLSLFGNDWPHRYRGNLELFRKWARPGTWARLVQGDSRRLVEVLREADIVLGSPPYASGDKGHPSLGSINNDNWGNDGRDITARRGVTSHYGNHPAQLANLPEGDPQATIGSPPYIDSLNSSGHGIDCTKLKKDYPGRQFHPERIELFNKHNSKREYGNSPNQLGAMPEGDIQATVGSPPFVDSVGSDDPDKRGGLFRDPRRSGDKNLTGEYGETEGQLGGMVEGIFSSPPFEGADMRKGGSNLAVDKAIRTGRNPNSASVQSCSTYNPYGSSKNQLGNQSGPTFWSAARTILEQCYQILPPGGVSIWVVKDFVRGGERVPFGMQWRQLCEAVGFVHLETHRALLVNRKGEQMTIEGETVELKTERKSFFRLLHQNNQKAKMHWETLGRSDKARYLRESHRECWDSYNFDNGAKDASQPTRNRIRENARKMTWVGAGKPDYEIETSIDYEEVVCMRKPRIQ